jgi:hypothetical protein
MNTHDNMVPISTPDLRGIIDAGDVGEAVIKNIIGGFIAMIIERSDRRRWILQTKRGVPRHFRTLDTAALYLRDLGIETISIDFSELPNGRQMDMFNKQRRMAKTVHAAAA